MLATAASSSADADMVVFTNMVGLTNMVTDMVGYTNMATNTDTRI